VFTTFNKNPFSGRAELFHADGRTDGQTAITKLNSLFRHLAKVPKNPAEKSSEP